MTKTALIVVGEVLEGGKKTGYERSKLYDPEFTTMFREGTKKDGETKE